MNALSLYSGGCGESGGNKKRETPNNNDWRDIPGFDGRYLINPCGDVISVYNTCKRLMSPIVKQKGNLFIRLQHPSGKRQEYKISKLVAATFGLQNTKPGMVLRHKNGLKFDNYIGNLEWINRQDLGKQTGAQSKRMPVVKLNRAGTAVEYYSSAREAARKNHMSYQTVLDRCHGRVKKPYALDGHDYQFDTD